MILALRTDKPVAELYLYNDKNRKIGELQWSADRALADTLLPKITELLQANHVGLVDITGVVVFTGQGSFTGLRIGTSVANALGYSLKIPVSLGQGGNWIADGIVELAHTKSGQSVIPSYDGEANITHPN